MNRKNDKLEIGFEGDGYGSSKVRRSSHYLFILSSVCELYVSHTVGYSLHNGMKVSK